MRRLAILLIIGILWLGGLHPDFAVADDHAVFQGQAKSMCDSEHSSDDGCLIHGNQPEVALFKFNSFEPPDAKIINSRPYFLSLLRHDQLKGKFSEFEPINGIKLTGIVIKRE